jgi:hypothetical protein
VALGHLFCHVAVEQGTERHIDGTSMLGFVIELQDEAFQVLAQSPFGSVESSVEGLRLMDPLAALRSRTIGTPT